jgi:hypothetical protein
LADILGCNPTWALNLRYGLRYRSIHVSGRDKTLRVVIGHSRASDGFEVNVVDFGMGVGSFHNLYWNFDMIISTSMAARITSDTVSPRLSANAFNASAVTLSRRTWRCIV